MGIRLISMLLAVTLVFTSVDITVFAEEQETENVAVTEVQETEESGEEKEGVQGEQASSANETEVNTEKNTEENIENDSDKNKENQTDPESLIFSECETEIHIGTQEGSTLEDIESKIEETESISKDDTEIQSETEAEKDWTELEKMLEAEGNIDSGVIDEDYGHIAWVIDADGKLMVQGTGDYSNTPAHQAPWYNKREYITSAIIDVEGMTDASRMFQGCNNLTNLDVSNFDTRNITNMDQMFERCSSLESLDVSNFDTRNVIRMRSVFQYCSNLKSLDVSNFDTRNVTDIGSMFEHCSNLTSLDVSNFDTRNVTYMGYTFHDCSNLKSLDVSSFNTRNVKSMSFMFASCSGLTSLNVSNFSTENVTKMDYTFFGCKSLTSLDLSNFDTGNVTDMERMFDGCSNMATVYTPKNVTQSVPLSLFTHISTDIWYRSDGTIVTELPQNLSYSVVLGKNYIPTEKEPEEPEIKTEVIELKKDECELFVYDVITKTPIGNAQITIDDKTYTTATNGIATFEASNETIKKAISVTASGYNSVTTYQWLQNKKTVNIGLQAETDTLQIINVTGEIGEEQYDLLREKLVLGYAKTFDSIVNITQDSLELTIKANKDDINYELITTQQDLIANPDAVVSSNDIFLTSSTGVFSIEVGIETIKIGNVGLHKTMLTNLMLPQKKLYVRATDEGGNIAVKKLSVNTTHNYLTQEKTEQKGSFSFGNKIKVTAPDDMPFLGGSEVKLGFDDKFPLEMEIDEDGKIKISYNKPADTTMEDFGKKYMVWEKKYKGKEKTALRQLGKNTNFDAGMITVSGKVCGYGEGNIKEIMNGNPTIKLGLMAEIEGKAGYKHYWIIGFTAVKIFVEGSVKGSVAVEGEVTFDNWKVKDFDLSGGSLNVKIEIEAGAGVGLTEYIYELEVSLTGSANYITKPARNYQKLWLEASGKVQRTALYFWEKPLWKSDSYKFTLYQTGTDKEKSVSNTPLSNNDVIMSDDEFLLMDRKYLNYTNGYNKLGQTVELKAAFENVPSKSAVVKSAVLPTTTPYIIETGGMKYLFWVDDIPSRDNYNRTAIVYAKSSNGINWSSPKRLISETEDNTIDGTYDVFVNNEKIYVVWQDGTKQLTENDSITDALKSLSIRYAVLDTTNDTITDGGQITDSMGVYMYPCVVATGDKTYFAYVQNLLETGNINGKNTQNLYLVTPDGTTKEVVLPDGVEIANMDAGIFDGQPSLVCEVDMDGDSSTNDDREIYVCNFESRNFSQITNNQIPDTQPVIANSGNIYWGENKTIMKLSSSQNTPKSIWNEQQLPYLTTFAVVTDKAGMDTILWEATDIAAKDGSVSIFQTSEESDGNWSNIVRFAKTTGTIASRISAAGSSDSLQVAHTEGIFLTDGTELKDLCVTAKEDNIDIAVEYIDFDEGQATAGNALTLKIGLINNGNITVNNIEATVGNVTLVTLTELNLKPYESRELEIAGFYVPSDLKKSTQFTCRLTAPNEINLDDNTINFMLGCPDVYAETIHRVESERTWLDISIYNNTSYEASGKVFVHKGSEDGEVIFSKSYEKLGKENGYAYSVDLGDYEDTYTKYYIEVTSNTEENNIGDNMEFVYIGYGTGIEQEEQIKETYEITDINLDRQTLLLDIGNVVQISCKDNKENALSMDDLLWVSSDKRIVNVDQMGLVTAYRVGTAQITAYYGDLSCSCTITVAGAEDIQSFTINFDTQGGNDIAPITNIKSGSTVSLPTNVTKDGCIFDGWYTQPEGGDNISGTIIVTESIVLYAHWIEEEPTEEPSTEQPSEEPTTEPEFPVEEPTDTENQGDGLWVSGVSKSGYPYTGEAVKPVIKVFNKTTLLTEKSDYTISYKNNTKAGKATITVTGKGNYSGKETVTFDILPIDIGSKEVHAMDFYVKIGKKTQKPVPELYYMGIKLKNNKDFKISYANSSDVYAQTGKYSVTITGKGNYTGTRTLQLMAVEKIVKPKPVSIAKASLNGFNKTFIYTGKACTQECILVVKNSEGEKILTKGMDYTIQYANNIKAGTATVTYYGKNGYTGKLKKTYKILPYNIQDDYNSQINYENNFNYVYAKGGSKPKPVVTFDGKALKEGVDYTLSYKNNKAVLGNQASCVVVNGKGCFKGKIPINFTITSQDLSKMTLVSGDKVYKNKANIYSIKPKLMDLDGKQLSAGKDFDPKSITYVYENDVVLENGISKKAGSSVEKTDIIPVDTQIRITLNCGSGGNYVGTFTGIYRIVKADIKSAKVTIPKQIYTGNEITLDKSQITVKLSGVTLKPEDYEIIQYANNVKKGKASVTIKGKDNYGGVKTVKFTIGAKGFLWWWRK